MDSSADSVANADVDGASWPSSSKALRQSYYRAWRNLYTAEWKQDSQTYQTNNRHKRAQLKQALKCDAIRRGFAIFERGYECEQARLLLMFRYHVADPKLGF